MHIKAIVGLVLCTLPSLSFSSSTIFIFYTQGPIVGPYEVGVKNKITINLQYYTNLSGTYEVFETYSLPDKTKILVGQGTNHKYDSTKRVTSCNYMFHFDNFITHSGMCGVLKIYSSYNGELFYEKWKTIYPINPQQINTSLYKTSIYKSKPIYIDFTKDEDGCEMYDFTALSDYLYNNSFSQLLLSNLNFAYQGPVDFSYKNAYLTTSDPKNLFSNLKLDDVVKIPLKIEGKSSSLTFNYDINSYINPKTLEMSHVFSSYFSKHTTKMYLPLNHMQDLENYPFQIVIEKAGLEKNDIIIPLIYRNDVIILDNCVTSDICVGGGIVK